MLRSSRLVCAVVIAPVLLLLHVAPVLADEPGEAAAPPPAGAPRLAEAAQPAPAPPQPDEARRAPAPPRLGHVRRPEAPLDLKFDVDLRAYHALGNFDGLSLTDAPAYVAADLRLRGNGTLTGGALWGTFVYKRGLRIGFGGGFYDIRGLSLQHAPLSRDLQLSLGTSTWGAQLEGFGGYGFDFGRFVPYVDLRFGVQWTKASVDVRSDTLGTLQTIDMFKMTPILSPRLGVKLRITDWLGLDVSVSASPIGVEKLSVYGGLTFTISQ